MKVLAIETATIEVGVAIADESGPLAGLTVRSGRRQVETLHPAIAEVCRVARIAPADLGAIAVDIGPGLFTGLRVGVAAAKALAAGLGVPVVTLTSLEVLAAACRPWPGAVVPVIDMRRGDVAWLMPGGPAGQPRVGAPAELVSELAELSARIDEGAGDRRGVLLVGDGALRYREQLAGAREPTPAFAGTELAAPPVASLAVLAISAMDAGLSHDPADVRPLYGRQADARINWSSREGRAAAGR